MRVELIKQPKHLWKRTIIEPVPRCSRIVKSCSSGNWVSNKNRCCRFAVLKLDGIPLCRQHAGDLLLENLLTKQGLSGGMNGQ